MIGVGRVLAANRSLLDELFAALLERQAGDSVSMRVL